MFGAWYLFVEKFLRLPPPVLDFFSQARVVGVYRVLIKMYLLLVLFMRHDRYCVETTLGPALGVAIYICTHIYLFTYLCILFCSRTFCKCLEPT